MIFIKVAKRTIFFVVVLCKSVYFFVVQSTGLKNMMMKFEIEKGITKINMETELDAKLPPKYNIAMR